MSQIETLGILEELQTLVSDKLQVVSYKWLSRNFLVSSNAAKRLLQDFVEKHGSGLQVVYSLSGWLKNNPSVYHIKLVSGLKLSDAKQEFDDNCSVQVYSVQACIPRDPAALWNAEFVQAEELFKQPSTVNNCLRDNRFCAISSSFVKRNAEGAPASLAALQPKSAGVSGPLKGNDTNQKVPQPQQPKVQQSSPKVTIQSPNVVKNVKSERGSEQAGKPSVDKERVAKLPASKSKSSSGSGGSLANMWGRASTKSKPSSSPAGKNQFPNSTVSAEAQISAQEALRDASSDDDDGQNVNFKRASNGEGSRKRRVVLDYSDEEGYGDAVDLALPDLPKEQSFLDSNQSSRTLVPENKLNSNKQKEENVKVKEENETATGPSKLLEGGSSVVTKAKSTGISPSDKKQNHVQGKDSVIENKVNEAAPNSPKRRKVLKTRIDERGREVNEVVWEGEEAETKSDSNTTKKTDTSSTNTAIDRPPPTKKSPAIGSTAPSNPASKAGNKKTGNAKDPKQGNILSFFKRV